MEYYAVKYMLSQMEIGIIRAKNYKTTARLTNDNQLLLEAVNRKKTVEIVCCNSNYVVANRCLLL